MKIIVGMALPRKTCRKKLESRSEKLNEHILKYILYKDTRPYDLEGWLRDIAKHLCFAQAVSCDIKLKKQDFLDTLFSDFGTEWIDARANAMYQAMECQDNGYPEIDITDEITNDVFDAYTEIEDACIPIFLDKSAKLYSVSDWKEVIRPILDK